MTGPSAQWSTDAVALDRAPEPSRALDVAASCRDAGKDPDSEHSPAVVAHLLGEHEESRALLSASSMRPASSESAASSISIPACHHSTPTSAESVALSAISSVRPRRVPFVPCQRAERADGLSEPPGVAVPLVDLVARLDERACFLEVVLQHRHDPEPMEQHGATALIV